MNPVEFYKSLGWYVTSPYGQRTGQYAGFHRGVDFGGYGCGADVKTPYAGTVVAAKTSGMGTWGNTVCIQLDPDGQYISLNAHLQAITVREGQQVKRGDVIGTNGGTNHAGSRYSCHIHYEIQKNNGSAPWRGTHLDPATFQLDQSPQLPSTRFSAGQVVKAITNVNIRQRPTTLSPVAGQVKKGENAQILANDSNGARADSYAWWRIFAGWVAEDFIVLAQEPDPTPIKPPEIPDGLMGLLQQLYEMLKILFDGGK